MLVCAVGIIGIVGVAGVVSIIGVVGTDIVGVDVTCGAAEVVIADADDALVTWVDVGV